VAADVIWSQAKCDATFAVDYAMAQRRASFDLNTEGVDYWSNLDACRQAVLVDMAYELGGAGLAKFKDTLDAVRSRDWPGAAAALKASKLFAEVPAREGRNVQTLLTGDWPVDLAPRAGPPRAVATIASRVPGIPGTQPPAPPPVAPAPSIFARIKALFGKATS
jgi:hypothetical protein